MIGLSRNISYPVRLEEEIIKPGKVTWHGLTTGPMSSEINLICFVVAPPFPFMDRDDNSNSNSVWHDDPLCWVLLVCYVRKLRTYPNTWSWKMELSSIGFGGTKDRRRDNPSPKTFEHRRLPGVAIQYRDERRVELVMRTEEEGANTRG